MASRSIVLLLLRCFITTLGLLNVAVREISSIDLSLGFTALSPPEVVAQRNQPLSLNCSGYSGSEYEPLRIKWLHQGVEIKDGRRQVLANGTLYIKRVIHQKKRGKKDEGNYTCVLQNSVGVLYSRPIRVIVARMAQTFSLEPQPVTAARGGEARFECQIHAVPPAFITWQQDGNDVLQNSSRHLALPSGVLQITNLSSSDEGAFRCVANSAEHVHYSQEAMLTVTDVVRDAHHLQFLNTVQEPIIKLAKETAILECLAQGHSKPQVTWTRQDGKPLPPERTKILGKSNLLIGPLRPEDAGVYICNASNVDVKTGRTHSIVQHTTLIVYVPPDFLKRPESKVKPTAQTARFECIVDGIPTPTVRWVKNGEPLYINGRIKTKSGNVLVISQTVTYDSGIYQCIAENAAGTKSAAARLQVNTSTNQPDPPKGLKARTLSSTSILLTWKTAVSPNGLGIQAYTVHYVPTSGGIEMQNVAANTSQVIDKLKPYTNYTFYVRAYNGKSASEQSEIIVHMTGEDVPLGAPTVTLSSLSSTTLHVSWDDLPSDVARGAIVKYRIHYRKHGVPSYSVIDIDESINEYTITGLQPKRKYDVRVMGATKVGFPSLSDEEWPWVTHEMPDAAMVKVPMSPILHLTVMNLTTLEVKWKMPPENRFAVEGYRLTYRKQNQPFQSPIDLPANASKFLLVSLAPQTWYEVHVAGYNSLGNGHESVRNIITLSPGHPNDTSEQGTPSNEEEKKKEKRFEPPQNLEADPKSSTSIQLTWEMPVTDKNITYYTVRYHPVTATGATDSTALNYIRSTNNEVVITDLVPFTLYEFAVQSHDVNNQQSRFSQKVECRTLEDIPSSPRDLTWVPVDAHSVRLNWLPPKYPNGVIITYYILYDTHIQDQYCLDSWKMQEETGSELTAVVKGLASNTIYYFCMRAETRAGTGPPTPIISLNIPVFPNNSMIRPPDGEPRVNPSSQSPFLGIVLGFSIGLCCVVICTLFFLYKNRCCTAQVPPNAQYSSCYANGHIPHRNGHVPMFSEKRVSGSDCQELDCFTPMLTHLPSNHLAEHHIDTKGGYPPSVCNGHPGGHSYPLLPNGNVENGGCCNARRSAINITENPQCISRTTALYIPAEQNGQCIAADTDDEDCGSVADRFPSPALLKVDVNGDRVSGDGVGADDSACPLMCPNVQTEDPSCQLKDDDGDATSDMAANCHFSNSDCLVSAAATSHHCTEQHLENSDGPRQDSCSNVPSLVSASSPLRHSQELLVTLDSNALVSAVLSAEGKDSGSSTKLPSSDSEAASSSLQRNPSRSSISCCHISPA